jgi:hypothetical protein
MDGGCPDFLCEIAAPGAPLRDCAATPRAVETQEARKIDVIAASAGKRPRRAFLTVGHRFHHEGSSAMNIQGGRPRVEMEQVLQPITMPRIGLGTWAIGGWMWGGTDEAESIRTIHAARRSRIRSGRNLWRRRSVSTREASGGVFRCDDSR